MTWSLGHCSTPLGNDEVIVYESLLSELLAFESVSYKVTYYVTDIAFSTLSSTTRTPASKIISNG